MDFLMLFFTLLGLLIAGISAYYAVMSYRHSRSDKSASNKPYPAPNQDLSVKLLRYFWEYPRTGNSESSWATKESAVLRGRLSFAREQPGLGVAIVTTQMAIDLFGKDSESRLDGCIEWAVGLLPKDPPHLLQATYPDPETSKIITNPDFRHTLAFAIILARTAKLPLYLREYVALVLELQDAQGGWPPGEGVKTSQLFTAIYAFELLDLCSTNSLFSGTSGDMCLKRRDRAAQWLIAEANNEGLWLGTLDEYSWNDLVGTAWVLHRVSSAASVSADGWTDCLESALRSMLARVVEPGTWRETELNQRMRVEARVGAATAAMLRVPNLGEGITDLCTLYLRNWRTRAANWIASLKEEEWDISTVAFLLDALYSRRELRKITEDNRLIVAGP